jgi:hypothetical protein
MSLADLLDVFWSVARRFGRLGEGDTEHDSNCWRWLDSFY